MRSFVRLTVTGIARDSHPVPSARGPLLIADKNTLFNWCHYSPVPLFRQGLAAFPPPCVCPLDTHTYSFIILLFILLLLLFVIFLFFRLIPVWLSLVSTHAPLVSTQPD